MRRLTVHLVLLGLTYTLFIQCTGIGIPCLFRLAMRYHYPGRGVTHAAAALLRRQSRTAWQENPLGLTVAPLLVFYGTYRARVYIRTAHIDFKGWEILLLGVLWVVVLLFWLLRDL